MNYIRGAALFVLSLLPFLMISRVLFLRDPMVWPDEAIFVDTAITKNTTGRLATEIFGIAVPTLSQRAYWYPPLYFHLLSFWIRAFGANIVSVRTLSFLVSLASLGIFFLLVEKLYHRIYLSALSTLILSLDTTFGQAARVARMDILTLFFIILTLLFYSFARTKNHVLWYIATGVSAALSVVTHPLGLIAPCVVGFLLLFQNVPTVKKMQRITAFVIPIVLGSLAWGYTMRDDFALFFTQYRLQFERKAEAIPYIAELITNFAPWRIFAALVGLLSVFHIIHTGKNRHYLFILPAVGLFIATIAILWGKENWYLVFWEPFLTLMIISTLAVAIEKKALPYTVAGALGIFLILLQVWLNWYTLSTIGSSEYKYTQFAQAIRGHIPHGKTVFLMTIPDPYFALRSDPSLILREFPTVPLDTDVYKKLLDMVDIIVINFTPDNYIAGYLSANTLRSVRVTQPGGYQTNVITLVPRDKRR